MAEENKPQQEIDTTKPEPEANAQTAVQPEALPESDSKAKQLESELLYQRAEFENYKKRMFRDQEQAIKFANEKFVRELSGIVDLLDKALSHSATLKDRKDDSEAANLVTGVEMTYRELIQLFSRFGVEFTGAVGDTFDPGLHEAISQKETSEAMVDKIVEVLQKGCLFHGRLLRPVKVVVGKQQG